ncbi:PEPxxWA-CTERM sorting domain-containing protein [Sphingosinicellaceae bacterium]|nr:PEPxxWA-CTERM sorting domain-containing protein [Sphingosinicellaceae bacterium]
MKKHTLAGALVLAALSSAQAYASNTAYKLSGSGVTGSIRLTYVANPNTGPLGTSPNTFDPVGSYIVTGISGTFSDSTLGISNATITGIVPSNPANPTPGNLLAPHSFGFYPILNGSPGPDGIAPGLSYDGLYYPGGSPQAASDYDAHGGFLDIYGIVFTITGGYGVNLWSNGDYGGGPTYGASVTDGTDRLDYVGGIAATAVPEPAAWALMIGGFAMTGTAMRRRTRTPRLALAA